MRSSPVRCWTGSDYLLDFDRPCRLWMPALLILTVVALLLLRRRPCERRTVILGAAPVVAALAQALYVLRVGGDFMRGRMWLPVPLPALLVAVVRRVVAVLVLAPVRAVWCGVSLRSGLTATDGPRPGVYQTWNERKVYVNWTRTTDPTTSSAHGATLPGLRAELFRLDAEGRRVPVVDGNHLSGAGLPPLPLTLRSDVRAAEGRVTGRLGGGGAVTPLNRIVVDVWGPSDTVGAHIERTEHVAAGREKLLPLARNIALYVDPAASPPVPPNAAAQDDIRAARAALECGDLEELPRSTTAPR